MNKFFLVFFLFACENNPPRMDTPDHRRPVSNAKVYKPTGSWNIRSESDIKIGKATRKNGIIIWDLQGGILDGSKQKGQCNQAENQEPIFRARISLLVRNGFIRNGKNAATFYAKNSGVDKVTWLNVCEDAVATSKGAYGFSITNSEFINHVKGDKTIQLNEAKNAIIRNNRIFSGRTCMRLGDSNISSTNDVARVENNEFIGCDTGLNAEKVTVIMKGNVFERVRLEWKASNGAIRK